MRRFNRVYRFALLALPVLALSVLTIAGRVMADEPAKTGRQTHTIIQNTWIPMPDGTRLSVDLYMPAGMQAGDRFPVLLEYLPYRKMESRVHRYGFFSWFVERGYIIARVDIRGTGESEGKLVGYEYTEQEQADGEAVIDWLSRQDWSTGNVGMFGISWGGFNAIQMAMRNPPALKAIIAVDATDDIYQDDVHFTDGIMHVDAYEMRQDLDNAIPGAPAYIIDEAYFENRFDTEPWFLIYKQQQRDGEFWDRASLNSRYDSIRIPAFLIGGWYDGYRDSIPRMLEHLSSPVKAMLGPWAHTYPNWGFPGEAIEWRVDALRWFDHWLKGDDNGIMEEPPFAVFIRDWHPPGLNIDRIPGHWRYEKGWPPAFLSERTLYLQPDHSLSADIPGKSSHELTYRPDVGIEAGGSVMWWGDLQDDQRAVDAYSLVYETPPLEEPLTILGFPRAQLIATADAPHANWIARLSDVAPDGRVTLITGAALNGAHRESAENPQALVPGEPLDLNIEMHFTSWVFPKGHRVRVAINNSQWPMFWPTPYAMQTTLGIEASRLVLPVTVNGTRPGPVFAAVDDIEPMLEGYGESVSETESGYAEIREVIHNFRDNTTRLTATNGGTDLFPWGKQIYQDYIEHQVSLDEPSLARVKSEYSTEVQLPDRQLKWTGLLDFSSDRENFYYKYTRRLEQNGKTIREKHWEKVIPRDFN